jgi:hypothetical protein
VTVPRCFSIPVLSYLSDSIKEFLFKCIFRKKTLDIGKTFHTTLFKKDEKIKGTQRVYSYHFQREMLLLITFIIFWVLAIQRGNAASIRGTFPDSAILSEIFIL